MVEYTWKATRQMVEFFEKKGVQFDVREAGGMEILSARFSVDSGPFVEALFISRDNDNDVAARVPQLIARIPENRQDRVREACCQLNENVRYLKFYVDHEGSVNLEYDFPVNTPDEAVGEIAFEIFVRIMQILNEHYGILMKAMYTEEPLETESLQEKMQRFLRMREARKNPQDPFEQPGPEHADIVLDDLEVPEGWIDLPESPDAEEG